MTNLQDLNDAIHLGVDSVGFIFYEQSPRCVTVEQVQEFVYFLPPFVTTVGVFVNHDLDFVNNVTKTCGLDVVQLHGDEEPDFCMKVNARVVKAFRVKTESDLELISKYQGLISAALLDSKVDGQYGGTGHVFDWGLALKAKEYDVPIILSGGINNLNIEKAMQLINPYAIDLCSGIENVPGKKDYEKMAGFVKTIQVTNEFKG